MPRSRGRPKTRKRCPGQDAAPRNSGNDNSAASTSTDAETQGGRDPWPDAIRGFHQHCGGLFSVEIIRPPITSADRAETAVAILNWFGQATSRAADDAPLCLDCDTPFSPGAWPAAFLVAMPVGDVATTALLTGICDRCARRSDDDLKQTAQRRLRSIWPDLRELAPEHFHAGGRA
jgi:hypothetical protein